MPADGREFEQGQRDRQSGAIKDTFLRFSIINFLLYHRWSLTLSHEFLCLCLVRSALLQGTLVLFHRGTGRVGLGAAGC